jgi:hypothetical protein
LGPCVGKKGRFTIELAIAKADIVINGNRKAPAQPTKEGLKYLLEARDWVREEKLKEALLSAMKIKFFLMAFASKVLMFIDPCKAVVYDNRISQSLMTTSDPELQAMAVSTLPATNKKKQAEAYARWCDYCVKTAAAMNRLGLKWKDWDCSEHEWRAVDVERAYYALGRIKRVRGLGYSASNL